jgi:A/G-specific adenine glycosylase
MRITGLPFRACDEGSATAFLIARGRRRSFQRRVLGWYALYGRDLPWRRTRDPYAILVSEVLSHQTQIARVLPVYQRLLGRYPTVFELARAPLAEVKAITDPLGYKIRGRWLHSAALQVADRPGAAFPETMEELRRLPGVGRYTAGAIMNFAHHRDAPVLDTNVARLLRRHFGLTATARARTTALWSLAAAVIPKGKGYVINQALMDLGAMICRSRAPRCDACPLRRSCDFRRNAPASTRAVVSSRPARSRGRVSPPRRPAR